MKARKVDVLMLLPDDGSDGILGKYCAWLQNARAQIPWLDYQMFEGPTIEVRDLRGLEVNFDDWFEEEKISETDKAT
jgi:hypothetical protein